MNRRRIAVAAVLAIFTLGCSKPDPASDRLQSGQTVMVVPFGYPNPAPAAFS